MSGQSNINITPNICVCEDLTTPYT